MSGITPPSPAVRVNLGILIVDSSQRQSTTSQALPKSPEQRGLYFNTSAIACAVRSTLRLFKPATQMRPERTR